MNEEFKRLKQQAFMMTELEDLDYDLILERFGQLVVKECVGVVEGGRFLHNQAPTALFAKECSSAIKRHFGVE